MKDVERGDQKDKDGRRGEEKGEKDWEKSESAPGKETEEHRRIQEKARQVTQFKDAAETWFPNYNQQKPDGSRM